MSNMMLIGNYLIYATAVGALLFMVGYGFFAPWWRSDIGRNLMAVTFSLLLIFGLSSITLIFGTQWPARNLVRIGVAGITCAAIWWRLAILVRSQIQSRRENVEQVR